MKKKSVLFKEVSSPTARKLKYEGFCPTCNKTRFFRWHGGSIYETDYRCMKCGNIVSEWDSYYDKERFKK